MRFRNAERVISDIGRRVAELRAEKDLTQEQLAEVIGMATQNLARVEQGRSDFRVSTLVRVARALGCDLRQLCDPPKSRKPRPGRPRRANPVP